MSALGIGIHGAAGRMGALVASLVREAPDLRLALATDHGGHPRIGADLGEVLGREAWGLPLSRLSARAGEHVDVVIDFSLPEGTEELLAALPGVPLVIGTTALPERTREALAAHARGAPVVSAPNFSQGVAVLRRALADVARHLPDWDVEIVEMHHRRKRDAPSGTALALGRTVAEARAQRFEEVLRYGRHGSDEARADGEIAIHALRGGDIVGEHTVRLSGPGEHVSLVHVATSREAFARGAIRAARWVHDKRPGAYTFEDVTA